MYLLGRFRALGSRRLAGCAAALGAVALAVTLTTPSASASTILFTSRLYNFQTGLCLDSNGAGNVYTDNINDCNGSNEYQNWNVWSNGNLGLGLQDQATGLCLDSNSAGQVYTDACDADDAYQEWTGGGAGQGHTFEDVATGLCLDSNGAGNVYTDDIDGCNWDNYQSWSW